MTVYVNERCFQCKASFDGWQINYFGVGEPLVECSRCGAHNDRSGKATEWQLMTLARKSRLLFLSFYWGCAYGTVAIVVVGFMAMWFWPGLSELSLKSIETLYIVVPGLMIGLFYSYWRLSLDIRRSTLRMHDPQYRRHLQKHHVMKLSLNG